MFSLFATKEAEIKAVMDLYSLRTEIAEHQVELTAEGRAAHTIPCARGLGRVHLSVVENQLRARCEGGCKEQDELAALETRAPKWWKESKIGEGPSRAWLRRSGKAADEYAGMTQNPPAEPQNKSEAGLLGPSLQHNHEATPSKSPVRGVGIMLAEGGPSPNEESRGGRRDNQEAGHTKEYLRDEQSHPNNKSSSRPALSAGRLKYAIAYARRGFRVFPCHEIERDRECSCGKLSCPSAGKHPRLKDWQSLATTDEDRIRKWWGEWPQTNVGVACGRGSNVTVLDVDGDQGRDTLRSLELEHGDLPETPIAITGGGGAHYYFAFEDGVQNAVRFAPGLDIRTEGGLVVGVGSFTKGPYEWEAAFVLTDELLPARMPAWLSALIQQTRASANGNGFHGAEQPIRAGEGRNNYLYRMGRSLKAKGLPAGAIQAALEAANKEQCVPPLSPDELGALIANVLKQPDSASFQASGKAPEEPPPFDEAPPPEEPEWFYEQQRNENERAKEPEIEPLKLLDLGQLYDLVDEWDRQPWIWEGILPRASLSLLVGKAETGKSTIIYGLIYAIVKNLEFFGRKCQQGRVLYLAGDPVSEIVAGKTFKAMGLVPGVDPIHVVPGALVGQPTGMQTLRTWVADLKPVLIVGDTMAATIPIDVDKYGQSYQVQQPLVQTARKSMANFLMSHHSQKSAVDSYSVIDAALGSVGVAAVASTRMGTKMYRRKGKKFFTFEMSNLRIGVPIEGEHLVDKLEDGRIELGALWSGRSQEMDREIILERLYRLNNDEGISERTLWNEIFPKPKWVQFKPALNALVDSGQVIERKRGKKGGGKEFLLASKSTAS